MMVPPRPTWRRRRLPIAYDLITMLDDASLNGVWLVIPCYNEGDRLNGVLDRVVPLGVSVVVVDDGSDVPVELARTDVHVARHCINLGQGAALQTGIDYAIEHGAEYLVTFDSDGQHEPADIAPIVAPLRERRADVTLGTRFGAGGRALDIPPARAAVLRAATTFTRVTTRLDITDTHNGFRGFTRDAARRLRITQNRMAHASQILSEIARLGMTYVEVPVTITYTSDSLRKGQRASNAFNILWDSLSGVFAR